MVSDSPYFETLKKIAALFGKTPEEVFQPGNATLVDILVQARMPQSLVDFYRNADPVARVLYSPNQRSYGILSCQNLIAANLNGHIPGEIGRFGFFEFASAANGDGLCCDLFDPASPADSQIYLISHDDVHAAQSREQVLADAVKVGDRYADYLTLFAMDDEDALPMDHNWGQNNWTNPLSA